MIMKIRRLGTALWQESIKRVPYVILVLIILLLFATYKNNQLAAQNAKSAADNALAANNNAKSAKEILGKLNLDDSNSALSRQLTSFSDSNNQQTLIMCKLFLATNNASRLSEADIAQIEAICKERIDQFGSTLNPLPTQPTNTNSGTPNTPLSQSQPGDNKNNGGGNQDNSPGLVDRLTNPLKSILNNITRRL